MPAKEAMLSKILNVIKTKPEMITAVVQTVLGVIVSLGFSPDG